MLIHHTTDTCSEFQGASALSSEKDDSEIAHLLDVIAVLKMPLQIGADDALTYVSIRIQHLFFRHYGKNMLQMYLKILQVGSCKKF